MADREPSKPLGVLYGFGLPVGLSAVLLVFIVGGGVLYLNTRTLLDNSDMIQHTHHVLSALDRVVSLAKDAETGQRGYLITGDARYLGPYDNAIEQINEQIDEVEQLTSDNPDQQARLPALRTGVTIKLRELGETIALRRDAGFDAARDVVVTDRGKEAMDAIRSQVQVMQDEERSLRNQRVAEMENAYRTAVTTILLTGAAGVLVSLTVAYLLRQAAITRSGQEWLQSGQIRLNDVMAGDQSMDELGENVLRFLAEHLDAHAAAMFISEGGEHRRIASYGVPNGSGTPESVAAGEGLIGQAFRDRRTFVLQNVPKGYLELGSGLGQGVPRQLLIAPATEGGDVNAVLEFGFVHPLFPLATEFFERVSESIGAAVRSVRYREELQNFLEETQRQAEELQAQSEELRVSNEELEEQSRAIRESQNRLENQQAELEQTNLQLEAQARELESQRDVVARVNTALNAQARDLEQASRYKSDFLANMSHELRTPLNSSLILAKLLADNAQGNLTDEQVQFAETIRTAGNDLLALINDILDLSKIEAGHMELRIEPVRLSRLVEDMTRTFAPVAKQRGLKFTTHCTADCPETIQTDRQRIEQVLKNLLSNALKFTEEGEVELTVSRADDGRVALAVRDTGIGVSEDKQKLIFEAFRQADGTTNRKYGGTGLGLSISRQLATLLGGEVRLTSKPGHGSTFTLLLPEVHTANTSAQPSVTSSSMQAGESASVATSYEPLASSRRSVTDRIATRQVDDDRDSLTSVTRIILVVEDDEPFARILRDLAHEMDFQCLVATTAEAAFELAVEHTPSAVILDVGLPDHSGLWVLDRLKHDRRTRHIPVHVVSASDNAKPALSLGAVGHLLKPVDRARLVEAFQDLESRLEQRVGRVLLVEDDPVQLESLRKLLGSQDVETIGASTAAECLARLKSETFDCMVLDLSLPDASGHALLETLSREDAYSFPPVIVYTGRDLSPDEEQRLRRYSQSIIIKGAKSPERLLDEITLFLHKVVSDLPAEQARMLEKARSRDSEIEGRRILVVEDDVRNVFALTSVLEPRGAIVQIARNGREALDKLAEAQNSGEPVDLVLMDVMMPEMDGITAVRELRKRAEWKKMPVIMLTAKAMKDDQEQCLAAGASDYMAKPLDVEKLLSLIRVWIPR